MIKKKKPEVENKPHEVKAKHAGGRPSGYKFELAQEICTKVACSSYGVKKLCRENEHWPSHETIYQWLMKHKEFADLYATAKKSQIEVLVDELVEISDDSSRDETYDNRGQIIANNEFINRSRVRIDTRKWLASKLIPRLYGDKITQEHTGANGEPIKIENKELDLSPLSAEELLQYRMLTEKISKKDSGEDR